MNKQSIWSKNSRIWSHSHMGLWEICHLFLPKFINRELELLLFGQLKWACDCGILMESNGEKKSSILFFQEILCVVADAHYSRCTCYSKSSNLFFLSGSFWISLSLCWDWWEENIYRLNCKFNLWTSTATFSTFCF